MTSRAPDESILLLELEEETDAIGRQLAGLRSELEQIGLEASGAVRARGRASIAEQLASIARRHAELRAKLWTYADRRRSATKGGTG
jgi:hypothetical protein